MASELKASSAIRPNLPSGSSRSERRPSPIWTSKTPSQSRRKLNSLGSLASLTTAGSISKKVQFSPVWLRQAIDPAPSPTTATWFITERSGTPSSSWPIGLVGW